MAMLTAGEVVQSLVGSVSFKGIPCYYVENANVTGGKRKSLALHQKQL